MDGPPEDQHSVKGCYVLVVVSEPVSEDHKQLILQRLNKGLLSWDIDERGCDLTGLENVCANVKDSKEAQESDVLIQYSTEGLGVEVLVNPPVSTLKQCMKNLLSSSIGHKHLIHSGYTFSGSGSWILQNGTFSFNDFLSAFQDAEVQNHKGSTIHVHCIEEGEWNSTNLVKEAFSKVAKIALNPSDRIDRLPGAEHLIDCLSNVLNSHSLDEIMEPSPLVGNVRFNSPTLYLFPAGDGDCSLFGVNGFNMLVDGGFSRKPCSWEFIRHLDRVDAVLVTRLNENNLCGLSTLMKRKSINNSSPEVGYVFCNIAEDGAPSPVSSEEFHKDKNDLLVSIVGEGHKFVHTLNELNLKPHQCWSAGTAEPCVLYHKVGQGTLEMYVLSPPKGSKEVKDFIQEWSSYKEKFSNVKFGLKHKNRDVSIPLSHATSICALVVWRPADPKESITRILLPGSAPQAKIFESLELLKNLDVLKQPTVTKASLNNIIMSKPKSKLEKPPAKASVPNRKNTASPSLSVSSVASRNGDIGGLKKEIKRDNKEVKKDNKEVKKEVKKENKDTKAVTEKKSVTKTAPKKAESSPPAAKAAEPKKTTTVKKSAPTPKKDAAKPASTSKPEIKKSTPKVSDSKTVKEITNKKVAETKTISKPKPKASTPSSKVGAKTEKSKSSSVTKTVSKVAKTTAAAAVAVTATAAAAAAITVATIEANDAAESKKDDVKDAVAEVQAETEKAEPVEDVIKQDAIQDQKPAQISVPPTPPEAVSPAPSETASLTPADTLSSAPMETVSPALPLPESASPGEEKEVNEIKEVDNELLPIEQETSKLEVNNTENEVDTEQERTLIDHSIEDTPVQVIENENNVEIDTDVTLDTGNKENEISTELVSSRDTTASFIGDHGSSDLMTTSFIKEKDDLECGVVEDIIERSSAVTDESIPSAFNEHAEQTQEELVTEQDLAPDNELENKPDEHITEKELIQITEHAPDAEGLKESEVTYEDKPNEASELAPENEIADVSEPVLEKEVVKDLESALPPESHSGETHPSAAEKIDEASNQEDIDSFLAGATMEGSICAGIPLQDERDFSQGESDFNANNKLENSEDEVIPARGDDSLAATADEAQVVEAYEEEGTAPETNEKFELESTTAAPNKTAVDEISVGSLNEHSQEKVVHDESEKPFTVEDNDLRVDHTEGRSSQESKELDDEKYADIPHDEPSEVPDVKESVQSGETDTNKHEIETNLMTTSLIGEADFGLDKEAHEEIEEIQTQKMFQDEKREDVEHIGHEEYVEDDKFVENSESSQNSQLECEIEDSTTDEGFDKNKLCDEVEQQKESETVLDSTETMHHEMEHESEDLDQQTNEYNIEMEQHSQSSVQGQIIDEHSSAFKEDYASEIIETETNLPDFGDQVADSSFVTDEHDTTQHVTDEIVPENKDTYDNLAGIVSESNLDEMEDADRDNLEGKLSESNVDEMDDADQPDEVIRKESAVSIVLETENLDCRDDSDEKRRESYAESEDDVDIHRYMVKEDSDFTDPGRLNVKIPSRDSDSDDEDVVKSPTPHAIVDYEGQMDDNLQETSQVIVEVGNLESNIDTDGSNDDKDTVENYASEGKQDFNEKDHDSAEDDEEMIRHPTPPGEDQRFDNFRPADNHDMYDEMRDPISQHFVSPPTFMQTSDVIDDPLYEEPEGSDSDRAPSPVIEQPVFGIVGEADFPELVNVSGGTTPSEPQSPKFSQDSKHKNNALGIEVMDALSEHDVSETSLHSPLCKDEQNVFDAACDAKSAPGVLEKEKCFPQQEFAGSFDDIKEQINANDADMANEMTTSGYTLDDISSSVLSSETQCSTVVTSESFSSSVITSEITANMQSSMYEQFNDEQEPVVEDMYAGDEKHEQESSKEIVQETHSTVTELSGRPDVENVNRIEEQHDILSEVDHCDFPIVPQAAYETETGVVSSSGFYADSDHDAIEDKDRNLQFPITDDHPLPPSSEDPDFHHDDHRTVEEKDIDLQFAANEDHQVISDTKYSEFYHDDEKISVVHRECDELALSGSSHQNGHAMEQLPPSEHSDVHKDCGSPQLEAKPFGVNDIESNHWQSITDVDSNHPVNCSSQFLEISKSNLKVEQEYAYVENSRFHSASPEDNIMENDSSPDVPSPTEPADISFPHISDQKNTVQADQQNNFSDNQNNFSHDIAAPDGFSSDNMNFPSGVSSIKKYDGRREDPYGQSDSEDEDSASIPGTVSPYAYTNKAYTQEEEELDGNNIYKQSLRIEQTSEIKSLSFDGNNPQQLSDDMTLSSTTTTRMTYSPGFPDMSSADPNYDFRLEEWGKPMGLPTPPESAHNLVKKTAKSSALNKTLNKSNDKRSSIDNGKAGSPLVGSKALSSPSKAPLKSKAPTAASNGSPVYVDLAYVPHHGDPNYCDVEFFKKVRARYYVLSGINPSKEVLNALLEAKKSWKEDLEVTIIPTYETDTLGYWMAQNQETLTANSIEVAPSASRCTVNLQDHETRCSAYRLEF